MTELTINLKFLIPLSNNWILPRCGTSTIWPPYSLIGNNYLNLLQAILTFTDLNLSQKRTLSAHTTDEGEVIYFYLLRRFSNLPNLRALKYPVTIRLDVEFNSVTLFQSDVLFNEVDKYLSKGIVTVKSRLHTNFLLRQNEGTYHCRATNGNMEATATSIVRVSGSTNFTEYLLAGDAVPARIIYFAKSYLSEMSEYRT